MCNFGLKTKKWVAVFRHNLAAQTRLSNWREPNNNLFGHMWHLAQKYTGNRLLSAQKCFQYLTDSHWQITWQTSPSDFCIFSFLGIKLYSIHDTIEWFLFFSWNIQNITVRLIIQIVIVWNYSSQKLRHQCVFLLSSFLQTSSLVQWTFPI